MDRRVCAGLLIWLLIITASRSRPVNWTLVAYTRNWNFGGFTGHVSIKMTGRNTENTTIHLEDATFKRNTYKMWLLRAKDISIPEKVVLKVESYFSIYDKAWAPQKIEFMRIVNGTEVVYTFSCDERWMYGGDVQILSNPTVTPPSFKDHLAHKDGASVRPTAGVNITTNDPSTNRTQTAIFESGIKLVNVEKVGSKYETDRVDPTESESSNRTTRDWGTMIGYIAGGATGFLLIIIIVVIIICRRRRQSGKGRVEDTAPTTNQQQPLEVDEVYEVLDDDIESDTEAGLLQTIPNVTSLKKDTNPRLDFEAGSSEADNNINTSGYINMEAVKGNVASPYMIMEAGKGKDTTPYMNMEAGKGKDTTPYMNMEAGKGKDTTPYMNMEAGKGKDTTPYMNMEAGNNRTCSERVDDDVQLYSYASVEYICDKYALGGATDDTTTDYSYAVHRF
ncbi:uncharacterized protein LOC141907020 [Tubulanus polymorphus]|uniref:uncharacterized protein LOC141907020 n=1 Tax=Tubulanus polymorphus TaxID=672921 RepID=UPI003DA2C586